MDEARQAQAAADELEPSADLFGISNVFRRMLFANRAGGGGGGGGGGPRSNAAAVRQPEAAQTMREAEVKGKLARFLAGMRAFERQQGRQQAAQVSGGSAGSGGTQPFPPALAEFIVWAGTMLSGEQVGGGASSAAGRSGGMASVDAAARRFVGGHGGSSLAASEGTSSAGAMEGEDDCCSICQEPLADAQHYAELGERLETACGHRFHAVCFARHLEQPSAHEPVCPCAEVATCRCVS